MLLYSKGFRLAGRTLTSRYIRLLLMTFDSRTAVLQAEMVNFCEVALELTRWTSGACKESLASNGRIS